MRHTHDAMVTGRRQTGTGALSSHDAGLHLEAAMQCCTWNRRWANGGDTAIEGVRTS